MSHYLDGKNVLITGGTGSLGTALTRRLLNEHRPRCITIFSRDELKQADMRASFNDSRLDFRLGDIRDYQSVAAVLSGQDIIFNTAALKRVEVCEKFPDEAIATNYMGASNIVRAIRELRIPIQTVINVGSDKGAKPLNVYGMTKALQESRLLVANDECASTRFIGVRYGNVMASRGSVIPIWQEQIRNNQTIMVTDPLMTRFLISLDQAVDTLLAALYYARPGEVYIPKLPAAKIGDMALLIGGDDFKVTGKGIGEKMHEVLITDEEADRTYPNGDYFVITKEKQKAPAITKEYISSDHLVNLEFLNSLLIQHGIIKEKVS